MSKRILTGIQPSGTLHIGNYFGAMRPAVTLQDSGNECFYFIANYHAMTSMPDPKDLRERTFNVAVDFLAAGIDPQKTVFCGSMPAARKSTATLNVRSRRSFGSGMEVIAW